MLFTIICVAFAYLVIARKTGIIMFRKIKSTVEKREAYFMSGFGGVLWPLFLPVIIVIAIVKRLKKGDLKS